jgi:uncharacterized OB-fold protein
MLANIVEPDPETVSIGATVEVTYEERKAGLSWRSSA